MLSVILNSIIQIIFTIVPISGSLVINEIYDIETQVNNWYNVRKKIVFKSNIQFNLFFFII